MLIAGIDEAGRGSILGPLVIAGVCIDEKAQEALKKIGVKDSKTLTRRAREKLAREISNIAGKICVEYIEPREIDKYVLTHRKGRKLNLLEAIYMAKVIGKLGANTVYVDSPDVDTERFKLQLRGIMGKNCPEIISEHKAERKYPVVAAASIIAKVNRDRKLDALKKTYGDIGSGYSTDEKTMAFLKWLLNTRKEFPDFVRKSWKPARKLLKDMRNIFSSL